MFDRAYSGNVPVALWNNAAITADGRSTAVDLRGYTGEALIIIMMGTLGGTTVTGDFTIQTGDASDGSDHANVASAEDPSFTQITEASDNTVQYAKFNVHRGERYMSLYIDVTGSPTFDISACIVLPGVQHR